MSAGMGVVRQCVNETMLVLMAGKGQEMPRKEQGIWCKWRFSRVRGYMYPSKGTCCLYCSSGFCRAGLNEACSRGQKSVFD